MYRLNIVLFAVLLTILVMGCSTNQYSSAPVLSASSPSATNTIQPSSTQIVTRGSRVGNLPPDFRYQNSQGQSVSLSDLKGKPIMLNFWATWCSPCRTEMPILEEIYRDRSWQDAGLKLLIISLDQDSSKVEKYLDENNYTFPVFIDAKQVLGQAYTVYVIPVTFLINKNGFIEVRREVAFPDRASLEHELKKIVSN